MSTNCIGSVRLSRLGLRLATNYELSTSRTVVRVMRYVYENQTTFLLHLYEVFRACETQDKSKTFCDFLYVNEHGPRSRNDTDLYYLHNHYTNMPIQNVEILKRLKTINSDFLYLPKI